ncbi:hypothetical protein PUNSTDRAFT_73512 [Punctularia strigosozonata HHB-11173 SS5]|uniref:uncharacterized protein n=1 Tax=Punctularia strigosozonata (strain HHB-11173) TaxID=741275 RepID=UPI0004417435|nr:uncharacterized protein PUNSTDRAFT_73512 [Punctularia strigosozonata HHB-11173 SS5]EIN06290.1 hypothetical protein PUNSTDRAFT_73512 [Punctularia strigosozonata HHB-11173 SS5]
MAHQPSLGPAAALIARVDYLARLLRHLPHSLPLNPSPSNYSFYIDHELVNDADYGLWYAFNRNLETQFRTHTLPPGGSVTFLERGSCYDSLIKMFKIVLRELPSERKFIQDVWLERLIRDAKAAGATIPSKKCVISFSCPVYIANATKRRQREADTADLQSSCPVPAAKISRTISTIASSSDSMPVQSTVLLPQRACSPHGAPSDASPPPQTRFSSKQSSLLDFGVGRKLTTSAEIAEKKRREAELDASMSQAAVQFKAEVTAISLKKRRVQTAARVAAFRERKKMKTGSNELEIEECEQDLENAPSATSPSPLLATQKQPVVSNSVQAVLTDVAELSRPGSSWKSHRTGVRKGTVQARHTRTNWYHPFLWADIDRVAHEVDFSATRIARSLQKSKPQIFGRLRKSTVQKWLSDDRKSWSPATLENVARRHALAGTGRVGILTSYPDIVKKATQALEETRETGIQVNRMIARSLLIAEIQILAPDLLQSFKVSESYISAFLSSQLNWSKRKITQAAAKVPSDAPDLCGQTLYRIVHAMFWEQIPVELVIGMDQIGVLTMPTSDTTYAEKGSRQVIGTAKNEKRAYTLLVASTPTGHLLPFQQVWAGKGRRSLPVETPENATDFQKAREYGFHITVAASEKNPTSHYSTLKTMKEWVKEILAPYIQNVIEVQQLPAHQKAILFIDCYPVHTSEEFRQFLATEFPNIVLIYVPANCTGVMQPADLGQNRPIKHFLRQDYLSYMVREHRAQIKEGRKAGDVKFMTSMPALRTIAVGATVRAYEFMQGPSGRDIIRRSWEKAEAYGLNLGAETLKSRKAIDQCREFLRAHPELRQEIEEKTGNIFATEEGIIEDEHDIPDQDDTDVPLSAIVRQELGIEIANPSIPDVFCVQDSEHSVTVDEHGLLHAKGQEEDIWSYRDDGKTWEEAMEMAEDSDEANGNEVEVEADV